jgi:hypothetical protein
MKPLLWVFRFATECHHAQLSRVFTIKKRTYQVCLECGHEFEYSWSQMHFFRENQAIKPVNRARPG